MKEIYNMICRRSRVSLVVVIVGRIEDDGQDVWNFQSPLLILTVGNDLISVHSVLSN